MGYIVFHGYNGDWYATKSGTMVIWTMNISDSELLYTESEAVERMAESPIPLVFEPIGD